MVNRKKSAGKLPDNHSLPVFSVDDCLNSVPAAGWRNGTSLNNQGTNGNYWSSTPHESNSNNAYNLNFNSGNHNTNWNNRNNGQSVRPVSELTRDAVIEEHRHFSISREKLLADLYQAYKDARRNKRGRLYQLEFEYNLEENLVKLCDELLGGAYKPLPSSCFIIHEPKMREVFAAHFRDRIVHHLFYNYTHILFERTFIYDSYSCIKNRGTHFGIKRLEHHIRSVSNGYSYPCYVLKIDIKGYFMSIDRKRLFNICKETLDRMKNRGSDRPGKVWGDVLDCDFIYYLLDKMIFFDPVENCVVRGECSDWNSLPAEKSLFGAAEGRGLPIGNLSSQLFSNIYLNRLDQFAKRVLGCRHYGRYVDDAYIVSNDSLHLKSLVVQIKEFLDLELGLSLSNNKVRVYDAYHGVEFLGAFIKPFRSYVSKSSLTRIERNVRACHRMPSAKLQASLNSCLGVLSHYDSFRLRRVMFGLNDELLARGRFSADWLIFKVNGLHLSYSSGIM